MIDLSEEFFAGEKGVADYGCDIATKTYAERRKFGRLLKLHGSTNWIYCPGCGQLHLHGSRMAMSLVKGSDVFYQGAMLEERYGCHGSPCLACQCFVRPVMITPSHMKDYRNPHIAQVGYLAERAMREADRAIFVGYSLPHDDVDVIYLLKRGLGHLKDKQITVVEFDPQGRPQGQHEVGKRYRSLFGDGLDWRTEGFGGWLDACELEGVSPGDERM
jgi:NAD-dependent SIR2 family protein deacetylase